MRDTGNDMLPYVQGEDLVPTDPAVKTGVVYVTVDVTVNVVTAAGQTRNMPIKAGAYHPVRVQKILSTTTAAANTVFLIVGL